MLEEVVAAVLVEVAVVVEEEAVVEEFASCVKYPIHRKYVLFKHIHCTLNYIHTVRSSFRKFCTGRVGKGGGIYHLSDAT